MNLQKIFNISFLYATWRSATPIMYAALAAVITQQADILNIGTEGIMLMGSFTAVAISYLTGNWMIGVLAAMISGMFMAWIMAVGTIKYKADINAIGIGINMLALALTKFLLNAVLGVEGSFSDPSLQVIPNIHFSFLENYPTLNRIFNNWSLTEWFVIVLIIFITYILYKTPWGLRVRAVGKHEEAAISAGINSTRIKYQVMLISGLIGGLAGAHLSMGYTNFFTENMTNQRGFVGVAAMFFGGGHPIFTSIATLIFGFADSIGAVLQSYGFPSQIILSLPYIITITVLAISMMNKKRNQKKEKSSLN